MPEVSGKSFVELVKRGGGDGPGNSSRAMDVLVHLSHCVPFESRGNFLFYTFDLLFFGLVLLTNSVLFKI
jgi:hypothetical protein